MAALSALATVTFFAWMLCVPILPVSIRGLHIPQPFSHPLHIRLWLIITDAMPGIGDMQLAGEALRGQKLCGQFRRDQGATGGIACHQQQRTENSSEDLQRWAFADDRRGTGG